MSVISPPAVVVAQEAESFLRQCAEWLGWDHERHARRRAAVLDELARTGTYRHTPAELVLGAKLAWRNHTRCVGKLYWKTLMVRDCRRLHHPGAIAAALTTHLARAHNGGAIRPIITVFPPDTPTTPGPHIVSPQLIRYAGYEQPDGTRRGDPANTALTRLARELGWRGDGGDFDRLPVLIRDSRGDLTRHDLPPDACPDVPITHPDHPWFAELGLRWYSCPTVSDMRLEIGGVTYPAAPFTGWYVGTEIGTRNFGDRDRYDLLPVIARRLGLSTGDDRGLWKDRALTELNVAVLTSYERAGVRMLDHHTMADQFHRYVQARRRAGEEVHAEWGWIIPPTAASATPVFHDSYDPAVVSPNFFR
ncbi:nitric oxide synthase oxygenase [Nonomuraea sp. PA05]|uniref:nitric oxide synthase oxygenase n=1 Tax=Nonomuraea sp. PA05 TaxID=2604466 RepID=UPI0011DAA1FC|nr:nitric oxide synthase oxygenase [Nonomuraea sp. PA05]TYB60245.1 nitric oxide synthase oxygenase [Nonomuraea sp. PA05]